LTAVYRIGWSPARTLQAQALGSTLVDGRWHTLRLGPRPRRLIYAASSRALAQLEKRVHANGIAPINQALFAIALPDEIAIPHARDRRLPLDWRADITISQRFGNAWLDLGEELAIWVPSYVEPAENNILINPEHADFDSLSLSVERDPFEFDPRLA
jgi:RES domain-containing protein